MKRKHISKTTKLAAALLALGDIPRDDAKLMSAEQFISLYVIDHTTLHAFTQDDHFSNLHPKLIVPHREKSKADTGKVAKARRIDKKWREFTANNLAKPPKHEKKHRWASRPFQSSKARNVKQRHHRV